MISLLAAFFRRDFVVEISYKLSFVMQFAGAVFQIALFYFLARFIGDGAAKFLDAYGGSYFAFVLVGIAYQNYFNLALHAYSNNLRRDQMLGTLEMMLLSHVPGQRILALSATYDLLMTSLRIVMYLVIGALFFGLDLSQANIPGCFIILILTISSFSGLGILSAAFIMTIKRGDPIVWGFTMMNTLFGGVYFTTDVLPPMLQKIALLLPMTHTLHAFRRSLLFGAGPSELLTEIVVLIAFSVVTIPLGLYAFHIALDHAKRSGTLGQY